MYKYFEEYEIKNLKRMLVKALDKARGYAGIPFIINSGYRSADQNNKAGGVKNSAHLTGWAVDIKAIGKDTQDLILVALGRAGFKRIGVYETHIHADRDRRKNPNVWFNN